MKKFLFITALTPGQFLFPLRAALFETYLKTLHNQSHPHWEALLVGEFEKQEGKIKYIKTDAITKSEKLKCAYQYLLKKSIKPDYIIRLDDDDIISPLALERASQLEFDCYSDLYHSFYDLTSGDIAQQKRPWLPNTIIHKYNHAVTEFGRQGLPLFMHDHSKSWHIYYDKKKIVYAPKKYPLYLRIISPTTISSGLHETLNSPANIDFHTYKEHLLTFGKWKTFDMKDFQIYKNDLINAWETYYGQKIIFRKKNFLIF